jgi:alpha-1,2-mannosyltransferase
MFSLFWLLAAVILCFLTMRVRAFLTCRAGRETLGLLHPYCHDGGGGERVLWVSLRALLACGLVDLTRWRVVVYTGDVASDTEIRSQALARFGVVVPQQIEFVRLSCRRWIEPRCYPVATLLGQSLGSLLIAMEAVWRCHPKVLVDTTGLHFCLPLLRASGVRTLGVYVHYPMVQSDMLGAVVVPTANNNSTRLTRSTLQTVLKRAYYRGLLACYSCAGRHADIVLANGSWTAGHLKTLWGAVPAIVFPPCDTAGLRALPLVPRGAVARRRIVVSISQFRPEKDQQLQVRAFVRLLGRWVDEGARGERPTLVLAGAVRHEDDARRLSGLRGLVAALLAELPLPQQEKRASKWSGGDRYGEAGQDGGPVLVAPNLPCVSGLFRCSRPPLPQCNALPPPRTHVQPKPRARARTHSHTQ